jgi:hypothetical protein
MPYSGKLISFCVLFVFIETLSHSQCLIPSPDGDTLMPVVNRMNNIYTYGALDRTIISQSVSIGNTIYIGGGFRNIGPNTGTGVVLNDDGTQLLTYKKWRINGPVYTSVPDGNGGYFIGGDFSKIGDSTRKNIAQINSDGSPTSWNPQVDDYVRAMAINNDTLIIGGRFKTINGQTRYSFGMINSVTGNVLPAIAANNALKPGTQLYTFKLVDSILFVGGKYNLYNLVGAVFKINIRSGGASNFPDIYQMDEVFALEVSPGKRRLYIGGHAGGGLANGNGYCIDLSNNGLLFRIDVGKQNAGDVAYIFTLKNYGGHIYAGGKFNFGVINNNNFNQNGLVIFDTATGAIRSLFTAPDGFISSIYAKDNKMYFSGEFNSIGGVNKINFAVFDTTSKSFVNNTQSISDEINTLAFSGNKMFAGGYFHSVGCVARNGLAAFDINTGQITPWSPNIYAVSLTDMKAKGDTVLMSGKFGQVGNSLSLGGFVAVNGITGEYYTNSPVLAGSCYDILVAGEYAYTSGFSTFGDSFLGKIYVPTLKQVSTWKPVISFQIKSIQKRNGRIYGAGDLHDANSRKGYLTEINDTTGQVIRTLDLNPLPSSQPGEFNWITAGVLAENKFYLFGNFERVRYSARKNFAVFDVDKWEVNPTDIKVSGATSWGDLQYKNGTIYFAGEFDSLNSKFHRYFALVDTSVGAIFPDRLKFNNDPHDIIDEVSYDGVSSFLMTNNYLLAAGNYRNISKQMFPSLAKLKLATGNSPAKPQGISGPDTIACPSQNNIYSITNSNSNIRYAWFISGQDITILNNGTDSILLNVGPLAVPGMLKAVAINECGRSDTVYRAIYIKTNEPTSNASSLALVRKTDTTATIRFTRGNGARRIVIIRATSSIVNTPQDKQEYSADFNFGAGSNIGNNTFVVYKGSGDSVDIKKLNSSTNYFVTVHEFNGVDSNTNYLTTGNPSLSFTTLAALPSLQASNITFTNVTQTSVTVSCTPGNGSGRLFVMRLHSTAIINPANTTTYSSSTAFGGGSDLGSGNFIVSISTSPVTITNLQPNTFYDVLVFEYNGSGQAINYLTASVPSNGIRTMAIEPAAQASNIVVSQVTSTTCTINCTPGSGQYRLVVMRKDSAVIFTPQDSVFYGWGSSNIAFGSGTDLGNNTYVLNASTPVNVSNLLPRTKYHIAIFEFNGSLWNNNYITTSVPIASFTTSDNTPTIQASNLTVSSITTTKATANCTSGNGSNRLIVIREGSPVIDTPVNGTNYPIGTGAFGGTNIGNHTYVLARQQPVNISSLSPGKTYYLKVFEYNGSGGSSSYLTKNAPSISFTTSDGTTTGEPSVQASNITISAITNNAATINCTAGNGQNRLVVIRQGSSLSATPTDGKIYNASTIFGSGDTLANNTYVISNTSAPITVSGLSSQAEYTVSVFEFNGSGAQINYLTSGNFTSSFKTLANKPTISSSNITISALSSTSATINCTPGNGQSRLVVIKQATGISVSPTDGIGYNGNPVYNTGTNIGDLTFVVDTTVPVTVTGLTPQTTYAVKVFEFNGSGSTASYLTTNAPTATFSTTVNLAAEPSLQTSGIIVSGISANAATISCTQGNGQNRLVVIRQGSTLSSAPSDGNSYTANTVFGAGTDIGTATYVVSNTTTPVIITGLQPQTDYTVSIFEFNGSGSQINYLTSGNLLANFKTLANKPTTPSTGIVISNVASTSATINCTTGNGQRRLVAIRQGTTITAEPSDGSGYNGNAIYGNGDIIGDQTFVIADTTTPVTVSGLQPQTTYTIRIFEYNGLANSANYLVTNSPSFTFTTSVVTSVIDLNLTGTSLKIFPNPVFDQKLNLLFETQKRGDLVVTIYSTAGSSLFTQSYPIKNNRSDLNIQLPMNIPRGLLIIKCSFQGRSGSTLLNKF